jgi:hypothetical protein
MNSLLATDPEPSSAMQADTSPKRADADILGEQARMRPPAEAVAPAQPLDTVAPDDRAGTPAATPPATDENQPSFIGERNTPSP